MKTLVLENDTVILTRKVRELLSWKFQEDIDVWLNFGTAFFSYKRDRSIARFLELEDGGNLLTRTTLDDYTQMENVVKILLLLQKHGKRINVFCDAKPMLKQRLDEYLDLPERPESEFQTPGERIAEKMKYNQLLKDAIAYHNVYQMLGNYHENEDGWVNGVTLVSYTERMDGGFSLFNLQVVLPELG